MLTGTGFRLGRVIVDGVMVPPCLGLVSGGERPRPFELALERSVDSPLVEGTLLLKSRPGAEVRVANTGQTFQGSSRFELSILPVAVQVDSSGLRTGRSFPFPETSMEAGDWDVFEAARRALSPRALRDIEPVSQHCRLLVERRVELSEAVHQLLLVVELHFRR